MPASLPNYQSATGLLREKVESQIKTEITENRYLKVLDPPTIISPLGAIEKSSGSVRLIHDGSRPVGGALNDYACLDQKVRFQTLDDAATIIRQNSFLAKVDLKSAYRSVRVHPSNWPACGLQWQFANSSSPTYLLDTSLPFGSRLAPSIFHRLSQAVKRIMATFGFTKIIAYLDDFLIIEDSYEKCKRGLDTLMSTLRTLGFSIAWDKVVCPTTCLTFLGVQIDSVEGYFLLPPEKLFEFHTLVKATLELSRISLKQLQRLAGKLNWAASVVRGGRLYLRRILDLMRPMQHHRHKAKLSSAMRDDLHWWDQFLLVFNGKALFRTCRSKLHIYTDSSNRGAGMVWGSDWAFVDWKSDWPSISKHHINVKETLIIGLAVRRWAPHWAHRSVVIHTDNIAARCALNKGKSTSHVARAMVREIFWLSTIFNFDITAVHIPGVDNIEADAVSRLHSRKAFSTLDTVFKTQIAPIRPFWILYFLQHMSFSAFISVFTQVRQWMVAWSP